jgi:hypothetical protein
VTLNITHGWTAELGPFKLNSTAGPINLTGYTIALKLLSPYGVRQPITGTVRQANQSTNPGEIYFKPTTDDFVAVSSPFTSYRAHWVVTDGNGDVATMPSGAPDEFRVWPL